MLVRSEKSAQGVEIDYLIIEYPREKDYDLLQNRLVKIELEE